MLQTLLFRTPVRAYRMVYVGALLSYAIVVLNWLRRAFVDENFQYGLLALYWLISKPINSEYGRESATPEHVPVQSLRRLPRINGSKAHISAATHDGAELCSRTERAWACSAWRRSTA